MKINENSDVDGVWQEQGTRLPAGLLQSMRLELGTGALTLSVAHIQGMDSYGEYVRQLPSSPAQLVNWVDTTGSSANTAELLVFFAGQTDAELNQNSMLSFFRQLMRHASYWDVLFDRNLQLTMALASVAREINSTGSDILKLCTQTKALGKGREAWDSLLVGEPLTLSPADRNVIAHLPTHIRKLKRKVAEYSWQVELVRVEGTQFRDEARNRLIPATANKVKAVEGQQKPAIKDYSVRTMALVRMQLLVRELASKLQRLEVLLRTVLTGSSHLHSAWQSISAYIDASSTKIQQIQTGQQLARFAIYFGQFLGQWKAIEQSALEMNRTLRHLKH